MKRNAFAIAVFVTSSATSYAQSPAENLGFNYGFIAAASKICGGSVANSFKQATTHGVEVFGRAAIQRGIDDGVKSATSENKATTCAAVVFAYGPNGKMIPDAYELPANTRKR